MAIAVQNIYDVDVLCSLSIVCVDNATSAAFCTLRKVRLGLRSASFRNINASVHPSLPKMEETSHAKIFPCTIPSLPLPQDQG